MAKFSPTTKDIALLRQLHDEQQLVLAPQFQRNAVWPTPAKAYLIDTILAERPIPLLFFQRTSSAQSGRVSYRVVDGQQRLRAIFEFMDGGFKLSETKQARLKGRKFDQLPKWAREQILQYDLSIQELSGYSEKDIRDMFVRMNKYVVRLSRQEIRHARATGRFAKFVEKLGALSFWSVNRVFSKKQLARFRAVEFCAELAILLEEGPQDKKDAIDIYYQNYLSQLPFESRVRRRLSEYLAWISSALPHLSRTRYRKPTDLYSLIGALDVSWQKVQQHAEKCGEKLLEFEKELGRKRTTEHAGSYLAAASRQTDNLKPRQTRIAVLSTVLKRS